MPSSANLIAVYVHGSDLSLVNRFMTENATGKLQHVVSN